MPRHWCKAPEASRSSFTLKRDWMSCVTYTGRPPSTGTRPVSGYPASDYPAKQEHFGITTVEAMSAGAVPVVYGSGGQKEIVTHGDDGLCWDETAELASQTLRLVNDPELRGRLSRQAVVSSRRFCKEAFAASVDRMVGRRCPAYPRSRFEALTFGKSLQLVETPHAQTLPQLRVLHDQLERRREVERGQL